MPGASLPVHCSHVALSQHRPSGMIHSAPVALVSHSSSSSSLPKSTPRSLYDDSFETASTTSSSASSSDSARPLVRKPFPKNSSPLSGGAAARTAPEDGFGFGNSHPVNGYAGHDLALSCGGKMEGYGGRHYYRQQSLDHEYHGGHYQQEQQHSQRRGAHQHKSRSGASFDFAFRNAYTGQNRGSSGSRAIVGGQKVGGSCAIM